MFHRIGSAALKNDLNNTLAICARLGNPERKFRSIHVAGTNGKGSSSHMLAAILQSAGYKTGLYTSPHLKSFTERIRINGQEISQEAVIGFVGKYQSFLEDLKPSFFEMTVGMAFEAFADEAVDIAVIEVGLGGRLDSTNVITPQLSLITNISADHQAILGNTLPEIASEKAGIIKLHIPAVISEKQPEVASVFEQKARQQEAPLYFATDAFTLISQGLHDGKLRIEVLKNNQPYLSTLESELTGSYQLKNIAGVLQSVEVLRERGFQISEAAIRKGIAEVCSITGLKGRWQTLATQPAVVCDTGHNEDGIKAVMAQIRSVRFDQLHIVIGVVNDKDLSKILPLFPISAHYYFCQPTIPRALSGTLLQQEAAKYGLQGEFIPDVNQAISKAKQAASPNDLIFIGGSTFVVAEVNDL